MYGLQHEAVAHTAQQAIEGPTITSEKQNSYGKTNGLIYIKKEKPETRMNNINKRQLLYIRFLT